MKKAWIGIVIIFLLGLAICLIMGSPKEKYPLPLDAGEVNELLFKRSPVESNNFSIQNTDRIIQIVNEINQLEIQKSRGFICEYVFALAPADIGVAVGKEGIRIDGRYYSADTAQLITVLEQTALDRMNGVIW